MEKSVVWHLIAVWAAILANACVSTAICADTIQSNPVLVFRIVNSAEVPAEVLDHAQKYVENIYRKSGIPTEWLTDEAVPECRHGARHLRLTILLVADGLARRLGRPDHETGFAISTNGQGPRRAYIF